MNLNCPVCELYSLSVWMVNNTPGHEHHYMSFSHYDQGRGAHLNHNHNLKDRTKTGSAWTREIPLLHIQSQVNRTKSHFCRFFYSKPLLSGCKSKQSRNLVWRQQAGVFEQKKTLLDRQQLVLWIARCSGNQPFCFNELEVSVCRSKINDVFLPCRTPEP